MKEALKIAKDFLNDAFIEIDGYAETDTYYLFGYQNEFDNCMVKVDKATSRASYYIITEHFKELKNITFKDIDAK